MPQQLYILKDGEPVTCGPGRAWDRWFNDLAGRRVARTELLTATIETVFTGIDRGGAGEAPKLYETTVRSSEALELCEVYDAMYGNATTWTTRQEALRGHLQAVLDVTAAERRAGFQR